MENTEIKTEKICLNCHHWSDKSWVNKEGIKCGMGTCNNPKNEVKMAPHSLISRFIDDMDIVDMIAYSIRYPDNFGCIFFESIL